MLHAAQHELSLSIGTEADVHVKVAPIADKCTRSVTNPEAASVLGAESVGHSTIEGTCAVGARVSDTPSWLTGMIGTTWVADSGRAAPATRVRQGEDAFLGAPQAIFW